MSNFVELTLENAAYGGDTIGRMPDGRAVFVPFGLPGETVRIRIVVDKKNFARAELLEVLEPSRHRIEARCQHFGECGGCHYQHISYDQQLLIKGKILRDQLERIGRFNNPNIAAVVPSPNQFNYRNQVKFHLSQQKKPGFIRADKHGVLEIKECHLPAAIINDVWPLFEIDPEAGVSSLILRLGIEDDILIALESNQAFDAEFNIESMPVSVVHLGPGQLDVLAGSEYTVMQVKDRQFRVSAASFFQVNTSLAEQMVDKIEEILPDEPDLVLELYSGVGLFSAFIAPRATRLISIEASSSAADDFVYNLDEFENVDLYEGPVKAILPGLDIEPGVVLVDPPRTGLQKEVIDSILSMKPELLIYISCDPSTLARDGRLLAEGGFTPGRFIPFDFFPQTYHIETLSTWLR
ncbi:MAG: class I SAM-dependent RNA methyltransferase [Anaerolineales bacterium]